MVVLLDALNVGRAGGDVDAAGGELVLGERVDDEGSCDEDRLGELIEDGFGVGGGEEDARTC